MLWCTELDTAENFGLTSIQKPLIAISKCPLINIHPVLCDLYSSVICYWNHQLKPYLLPLRKYRVN